jgi:hypothetical protein
VPGSWEEVTELSVVTQRKGKPIVRRKKIRHGLSGGYQWETFHQAIGGKKFPGEIAPERVSDAIKVIAAMARAERTGQIEKV